MPAFAGTEMPQARIATNPRRLRLVQERVRLLQPRCVQVLGLIEVDVEEVVGGGPSCTGPAFSEGI